MRHSGSFRFLNLIRRKSVWYVLIVSIELYVLINFIFGVAYFYMPDFKACSFGDCLYFSFITAATIGYGDITPTTEIGKIAVAGQSVLCTLYIAVMMSVITSKILWPQNKTAVFSKKIVVDTERKQLRLRIINTNSMPIIHPEIRLSLNVHEVGDVIAGVTELDNSLANPIYLGRHDFTITFGQDVSTKNISEYKMILLELQKALEHQKQTGKNNSRFRIVVCVSGSNGVQTIAEMKKYYASDFVFGTEFNPIEYKGNDDNKLGIKYDRIKGFWSQFESIKNESALDVEQLGKIVNQFFPL
ncbi:MAG: two pore domain potassium channel family protein [Clostridia bacterium]|nr:two pore domain potassium channel family protein [Clostridia bacterium]